MRRFKNDVADGWLFTQELRFIRNFLKNWRGDVIDEDFFDPFANGRNTNASAAKEMVRKTFTTAELRGNPLLEIAEDKDGAPGKKAIPDIQIRRDPSEMIQHFWNSRKLRSRCRAMLLEWTDAMERKIVRRRKRKDPMEMRAEEICKVLKLDEVERDVFLYAAVRAMSCFDDFPVGCTEGHHDCEVFFAMAIDRPVSAVVRALSAEGRLRKFGVLDDDCDLENGPFRAYLEQGGGEMLEGQFYRRIPTDKALPWTYFGKLAEEHGDLLKKMIASAGGKDGVNILFYGAAGTGKTSFAATLAKELGFDLFEIRQGDREGDRNSPRSRIAGIRICNGQVPRGHSLVVVDEADQLLRTNLDFFAAMHVGIGSAGSEKGVLNTILDETRIPTIWISNTPAEALDDSVRRRFDYSIRFEALDGRQRLAIWRNNVERLHLGSLVPEELQEHFAEKYRTSAGGISMVLRNVKRMRPARTRVAALIDRLMTPHCELMGSQPREENSVATVSDYSLEGLNVRGDVTPDRIVEAVRRFRATKDSDGDPDRPRMNLLLWGPPGTGKTEFVRHLGSRLDARVISRMGSDLLSMWVGGTEKNIAQAFSEAEAGNAILFLDEIDGLVQDRGGAQRSWEVTQVNELLHHMEEFKGVMVGATNFLSNLDAAIMRRFTFKLQFDYLDDAGKRLFFERMFHAALTDDEFRRLAAIPHLAPGDFRTVRQSLYYLGTDVTNAMRLSALERESHLKKDVPHSGAIGFAS